MLGTYLKFAIRGYLRHRVFTALNIISLTIGLLVAYVAFGYLYFELNYDAHHAKADNLHRLVRTYRSQDYGVVGFPNWSESNGADQLRLIQNLKNTPGVADACHFVVSPAKQYLTLGQKRVEATGILSTNTPGALVSMFSWKLKKGSFQNFGQGPNNVVLTESVAKRFLGENETVDMLAKTIRIEDKFFKVAAIIEDLPLNSHFDFTVMVSVSKIEYWGSRVYVETQPQASAATVTQQLNASMAAFNPSLAQDPLYKGHFLQNIKDIHFSTDILYEQKPAGNFTYVLMVGLFALFTIFITLFNYSNLTLAVKSRQHKAIGVQKTMGATRGALAVQLMTEGVLICLLSLPFVVVLVGVLVPYFNSEMGVEINDNLLSASSGLLVLVLLALFIGLLASAGPVVHLAGKNILNLLKKTVQPSAKAQFSVRNYLIVSQLSILICISSIAYFVARQIDFIEKKDVGFQKDNVLFVYTSPQKQNLFQEKLRQLSEVSAVGNGSSFGITPFNQLTYKLANSETVFDDARQLYLDFEALKAYQLKTTLGRNNNGTRKTLINRTAAQKIANFMKISVSEIVGLTVVTEPEYVNPNTGQAGIPFTIDGVFEDINLFSLHQKIEPYFITVSKEVRLDGRTIVAYKSAKALKQIEQIYAELNEPFPLEMEFLNQNIEKLYWQDQRTSQLLFYFNLIAVVLASLGIVGITLFLTMTRTKEMGIRKVLGASVWSIVLLSAKEYALLVAVAVLISYPVSLFLTQKWLSEFAYRVDIQHFVLIVVGILTLALVFGIVALVSLKAALMNPVKSLKTE